MACNCKKNREIYNVLNNNHTNGIEKKGTAYYVALLKDLIALTLNRLIVITVFVIVAPIVFIVVIINMLFGINGIRIPNKWIQIYKARIANGK